MNITTNKTIKTGKYLVSPLVRLNESGRYKASVSIRSGYKSSTHDRIFRFTPDFPTHEGATEYALAQGTNWLNQHDRMPFIA
jgi:hypothetical protein